MQRVARPKNYFNKNATTREDCRVFVLTLQERRRRQFKDKEPRAGFSYPSFFFSIDSRVFGCTGFWNTPSRPSAL